MSDDKSQQQPEILHPSDVAAALDGDVEAARRLVVPLREIHLEAKAIRRRADAVSGQSKAAAAAWARRENALDALNGRGFEAFCRLDKVAETLGRPSLGDAVLQILGRLRDSAGETHDRLAEVETRARAEAKAAEAFSDAAEIAETALREIPGIGALLDRAEAPPPKAIIVIPPSEEQEEQEERETPPARRREVIDAANLRKTETLAPWHALVRQFARDRAVTLVSSLDETVGLALETAGPGRWTCLVGFGPGAPEPGEIVELRRIAAILGSDTYARTRKLGVSRDEVRDALRGVRVERTDSRNRSEQGLRQPLAGKLAAAIAA